MAGAVDHLRGQAAAGQSVTAADLALADAADRLDAMQAEIDAEHAIRAAEAARAAAVEQILDDLATFVDTELDEVRALWDAANATIDQLDARVASLQAHVRTQVHTLSTHGLSLGPDGDLHTRTAGRVLYDRDQLFAATSTRKLPMAPEGWRWLANRRAERDDA